jgi:hypothetical protein
MGNDEMMRRIHGALHVVADDPAAFAAGRHRARIGIGQRDLLVLARHHPSIQCVEALYSSRSVAIFSLSRVVLASGTVGP